MVLLYPRERPSKRKGESSLAVALEFINLIIRIDAIEAKYEGGWPRFKLDNFGWYDSHLYRTGAMSSYDMEWLVGQADRWGGLELAQYRSGKPARWLDGCVCTHMGPTLPCDWLAITDDRRGAYLKGTEPGQVITRHDIGNDGPSRWVLPHDLEK